MLLLLLLCFADGNFLFFSLFSSLVGVPVLVFSSLALPSPSEVFVPGKKKTFFKIREKKSITWLKKKKLCLFFF